MIFWPTFCVGSCPKLGRSLSSRLLLLSICVCVIFLFLPHTHSLTHTHSVTHIQGHAHRRSGVGARRGRSAWPLFPLVFLASLIRIINAMHQHVCIPWIYDMSHRKEKKTAPHDAKQSHCEIRCMCVSVLLTPFISYILACLDSKVHVILHEKCTVGYF